jgi:hypothetical protein
MSGMTVADQILAYLKVLVWPIVVTLVLVLFREPIAGILNGLEEFEGFGVKAKVRRQVTQAARDSKAALERSPIIKVSDNPIGGSLYIIGIHMLNALRFSSNLVPESGSLTRQLQRMRLAVQRLDTAIIAVLVATAVQPSSANRPDHTSETLWRDMTPNGVELYMIDLTGFAGWRGVIETRDLLSGSLVLVCGKSAEALTPEEADLFVTTAQQALGQLSTLVRNVAISAPG